MRSASDLAICAVACLAVAVDAHGCLLNPTQRGVIPSPLGPANAACFLTTGPCGKAVSGAPVEAYKQGQNVSIIIQKNQDHWKDGTTGQWTISFSPHGDANFHLLTQFADDNSPSLTVYNRYVIIPKSATTNGVIQVVYDAQAIGVKFFQCADVQVI